jgi:FHA domain
MIGYKQCEKGHYFKEELSECPYCPKSSGAGADDKTKVQGGHEQTALGDKTQIFGAGMANPVAPSVNPPVQRDLNKTFIQEVEEVHQGGEVKEVVHQRATRKIVGWLISYTLDPMGIDYRLYEGNNTLGRNPGNDVTVAGDPSISGHHATLLFKKGRFYLKDEMAANGTFINDEEIEVGQPHEVADGDTLRFGNSVFKFKTPL